MEKETTNTRIGSITKSELAKMYKLSPQTLARLMNNTFYNELLIVGYIKINSIIAPIVVERFIELYGKPMDTI